MPIALRRHHQDKVINLTLCHATRNDPTWIVNFSLKPYGRFRIRTGTADIELATRFAQDLDIATTIQTRVEAQRQVTQPPQNPRQLTITQLIEYYLNVQMVANNNAERSIENARSNLADFTYFARQKHLGNVSQLSTRVLTEFAQWRKKEHDSARTIVCKLSSLRAAINAAITNDLLDLSPIKTWPMPAYTTPEIIPFEPPTLHAALLAVRQHAIAYYPIILLIATTGLRPSDARALTPHSLHLNGPGYLHRKARKTGEIIQIPLGPQLTHYLRDYLQRHPRTPQEPIFRNPKGNPFGHNELLYAFSRALKLAKHPDADWANIKTLRHTFAHILINHLACPLPTVQRLMGHARIETTLKYVRPTDARPHTTALENITLHGTNPQPPTMPT